MAETGDRQALHENAVWLAEKADPNDSFRAFEAYGHAMTAASMFEQLMALMIIKAFALRLDKRANAQIQPADHPRLLKSVMHSTYDRLQRKLADCFALSAGLKAGLEDGKGGRDYLAHNFWQAHAVNLLSAEGVDIIATVCASYANHYRLLTTALFEETGVNVNDYVQMLLDDPDRTKNLEGWKNLLEDHGLV